MSRIYRLLLSDNVVNRRGVIGQLIGDKDISDHYPFWIVLDNTN